MSSQLSEQVFSAARDPQVGGAGSTGRRDRCVRKLTPSGRSEPLRSPGRFRKGIDIVLMRINPSRLFVLALLLSMSVVASSSAYATVSGGQFAAGALPASFPSSLVEGRDLVVSSLALTRGFGSSFGSFPLAGDPQALTVDQATGDVYVVSPSSGTVSRFTSTGAPDDFTAGVDIGTNTLTGFFFDGPSAAEVAVASVGAAGGTAGDIYVASFAGIDVFAGDGTHLGQITQAKGSGFEETCGVATDSAGKLYVGDFAGNVDRYVPAANPVTNGDYDSQITGVSSPCEIAVDSTGAVYASTWSVGPLTKYTAADFGTANKGTVIDTASRAVAVDPSSDEVYVDEGNKISVYDTTGTLQYTFGAESDFGTNSTGVAVNASGDAYVADPVDHRVDVYGPAAAVPPTAKTEEASSIHHVNAVLNGHLDTNGGPEITDCHFDWGTTNSYGNTAPCEQGNDYTQPTSVSAKITGLEPGGTYHYRLVVSAGASTGTGEDQTFETSVLKGRRDFLGSIGPDGASSSSFSELRALAFRPSTSSLYALDANGIHGFDASALPSYTPIAGFSPLATAADGEVPGLAVDTTGLSSAGDLYFVSEAQGKVYGFDTTGTALGGAFPIEPANTPGAPAGSPTDACGAAVDSTGQVWVSNFATRRILRYSPTGVYQGSLDVSSQDVSPCALAFDSNDDLYVSAGSEFTSQPTWRYTASSGYTAATRIDSHGGGGLAVNQADHHVLVAEDGEVREFDSSGRLLGSFAENVTGSKYRGLTVDPANDHVFLADEANEDIRVYGPLIYPPDVNLTQSSAITNTTASLAGTVDPQGFVLSDCHFEYTTETEFLTSGFTGAAVAPCSPVAAAIPTDIEDHAISTSISGLQRNTTYRYRLAATNTQGTAQSSDATFTTTGPPSVETVGSPMRTTTTAHLEGRLDPNSAATTYHFEYGDQGPCESNPCTSTPTQSAGNGNTIEFVSQQITGLKPNTTYHYRLIADNGNADGSATAIDRTLTTRTTEAPLTHGHFPGPTGSDRAWEQVNIPNTNGNAVAPLSIATNGERVIYSIDGGSPGSTYGGETFGNSNDQFAERTPQGWQRRELYPTRTQAPGNIWLGPWGSTELTELYALNYDETHSGTDDIFRMTPGAPAQHLFGAALHVFRLTGDNWFTAPDDGSRMIAILSGSNDPAYPLNENEEELYDLSDGSPKLIGLLPGNTLPSCGVQSTYMKHLGTVLPSQHWVTSDGSHVFFNTAPGSGCGGQTSLYDRNLVNSTTTLIAPGGRFIRSTAGAVFFVSANSLVPGDPAGNDIYRYQIDNGSIRCITCAIPGGAAVQTDPNGQPHDFYSVAVSEDGSRVYFLSSRRLLPGAASSGIYRVDVANGDLAYVAPAETHTAVSANPATGGSLSPDGAVYVFWSASRELDALNGQQNGGTGQYYRYDDRDRSLVCASCPPDGSSPRGAVSQQIIDFGYGTNGSPIDSSGDFVFATPTPLVPADQNTAALGQEASRGADIYEWRDGRLLLVTDGKTEAAGPAPRLVGVAADGRDVFFTQAAALTPDAIDSSTRMYDARIGGGFDFPPPPPPCSLEACQGIASPPPNDGTPASLSFSGPGNQASTPVSSTKCVVGKCGNSKSRKRCVKGKTIRHGKCSKEKVKRKRAKKTSHHKGGAK